MASCMFAIIEQDEKVATRRPLWAAVVPYFQHNLAALFKPARKNN